MKKYQKPELFTPSKEEVSAAAKRLVVESVSNNTKINQMENTIENKKKFFGLYRGQKICKYSDWEESGYHTPSGAQENEYLELKPLSSITDDDLGNIARFYKPNAINVYIHDDQLTFDYYHGDEIHSAAVELNSGYCLDYLRSNNYATEWMGLSVKQLEEYGWIKIKN